MGKYGGVCFGGGVHISGIWNKGFSCAVYGLLCTGYSTYYMIWS